tara:strand:- start:16 stop:486 length:471 start_codon:yes stop_codon:yes gene_type:complete
MLIVQKYIILHQIKKMIEIKKFGFDNKPLREKAFAIRNEVFVIGQNCPKELEYESEEESIHFLLLKNNHAVATARYRILNSGIKMERFAVIEKERGHGYGMMILKEILRDLKDIDKTKYLHAQVQVVDFYKKVGFKKTGKLFEEAGIMHYKMIYCN